VFNTLTSALKDLGKSMVAMQSQKKLQDAKALHASTFKDQWNAEKEFYKKKKKFMKNYVNTLKEKDQKMEDSVVQRHINIEEQLKQKNQEIIGINRKERKKKELEE